MFDFDAYKKKYTEKELFCIRVGTQGFLNALMSHDPVKAAALASEINRFTCHKKPLTGTHLRFRKGWKK